MGAFELQPTEQLQTETFESPESRGVREESVIAFKVYDSCRNQDCLTPSDIGPARSAESSDLCGERHKDGDIIKPPENAATVTSDHLKIKKIIIVDKQPCPYRQGFWDIDIKFVFDYRLTFREADGCVIDSIKANNIFNMKLSLFGSTGNDISVGTDLFRWHNESATFDLEPFIWVESSAVALHSRIHRGRHDHCDDERSRYDSNVVLVTIGLFSIVRLFRLVNLTVESRGFSIPKECEEISPISPCEYFEDLDFPMDIFAPPQKPEFLAGISSNIKKKK